MHSSLEDIIADLVGLFRPYVEGIDSVLDIGTGTSIPIHLFASLFPDVRYNTVDIVDIRKRTDLPFTLYDGKSLPFENSEFEVALLNETLHHCDDPGSVLAEAGRVARFVYVIEHFPDPGYDARELIDTEIYALLNFDMGCCHVYNPFTEDSLYLLFEKSQLTVCDRIEIPYYGKRKIRKYFFKLRS